MTWLAALLLLIALPGALAAETRPPTELLLHYHWILRSTSGAAFAEILGVHDYRPELWRTDLLIATPGGSRLAVSETAFLAAGTVHAETRVTDEGSGFWVETTEMLDLPISSLAQLKPDVMVLAAAEGTGRAIVKAAGRSASIEERELAAEERERYLDRPLRAVLGQVKPPPSLLEGLDFLTRAVCPLARREISETACRAAEALARTFAGPLERLDFSYGSLEWERSVAHSQPGLPEPRSAAGLLLARFDSVRAEAGHLVSAGGDVD